MLSGGENAVAGLSVVVLDYGVKLNQVRALCSRGAEVILVRQDARIEDVLRHDPHGVVLSNGPGDPSRLPHAVQLCRDLLDRRVPLLGICLGHQILGQAAGASTSRLGFGHHGGNHPVRDTELGTVYVTSQNHEFQVDGAVPARGIRLVRQRAQSQRRQRRRTATPRAAGVFGAVPPGGGAWAAGPRRGFRRVSADVCGGRAGGGRTRLLRQRSAVRPRATTQHRARSNRYANSPRIRHPPPSLVVDATGRACPRLAWVRSCVGCGQPRHERTVGVARRSRSACW